MSSTLKNPTMYIYIYIFFFPSRPGLTSAYGILVPGPGIEPVSPAVEAWRQGITQFNI